MIAKRLILLAMVLTASAESSAQRPTLDQIVQANAAAGTFMGNVLVAENGRVVFQKSYGLASLEWNLKNTPETKFRIGSITKQFTAALVLLLQHDGKLRITDPVSKYLRGLPEAWEQITIQELLNQTSGIPDFRDMDGFRQWSMVIHTPSEELAFFRNAPLDFEPGSKYAYSNSNYELLGMLIERVGGTPYATQLDTRILRPLGMTDSGLDRDNLVLPARAEGYGFRSSGLVPARTQSMSVPWAAGSMYSTTADLLRWEEALFGGKLLSADSLRAMTTSGKGQYGLGVQVIRQAGETVIWHDGGLEGFTSYLSYVPSLKLTVVVLGNVGGDAPDIIGRKLLAAEVERRSSKSSPEPLSAEPVELSLRDVRPQNVKVRLMMYLGRSSLQVVDDGSPDLDDAGRLAILPDSSLEDGTIEVDLSGDTVSNAAQTARGFVGLAFRVSFDRKQFECFYLRPKNGRSKDQLQRNHSVQYISLPGFPWEKLREEHPGQFESYTDLVPGQWTHVKIEVHSSTARLYVNYAEQPSLIVNELKQSARSGALALWIGPGTVAHFANLTIQRTERRD